MLIALNQLRRRHRHRLIAVLLALALCWLLIAAHSALAERHMGDDMAVCLAVAQSAALVLAVAIATVAAATTVLPGPPRWRLDLAPAPGVSVARAAPDPCSRAGPAFLQVFRR